MGTAPYMSPEQIRGEPVDARSDIFSFGAVLYEMATGQPPFSGETIEQIREAILSKEPASPRKLNPRLPAGLEGVIVKALQKERSARYQSASDVLHDLNAISQSQAAQEGLDYPRCCGGFHFARGHSWRRRHILVEELYQ